MWVYRVAPFLCLKALFMMLFIRDLSKSCGMDLINSLEVKTSNAIEEMKDNDMIANQNKFKSIVLTKTDHNTAGIRSISYIMLLPFRTK